MRSLLMPLLHPGGTFPELTLTVPGGEIAQIPEAFAGQFGDAESPKQVSKGMA
jgi:hypothetical protein